MKDIAKAAYEATAVGAQAWLRPASASLDGFEAAVDALKVMSDRGLVTIQLMHRESYTGSSMIDAVKFVRLR